MLDSSSSPRGIARTSLPQGYTIGLDVGGTKIAAGILRLPSGECLAPRRVPTLPLRGGMAVLADVAEIIRELCEVVRQTESDETPLIGIGLAELVSPQGAVLSAATIDWRSFDLHHEVARLTGKRVYLDADVRAAARAEAWLGAAQSASTFLYVTLGTGISAALVLDGKPFVGATGRTGTFASSPGLIPSDQGTLTTGPPLEAFAAGPAIATRYARAEDTFGGTAVEVAALAAAGSDAASDILMSSGRAVGAAIAQLVNTLDPERVVLGGGLGVGCGIYRAALEQSLRQYVWSEAHRSIPLTSALLGNDAGWIGAALGAVMNNRKLPA